MNEKRICLLVLGMHRSGTSALAHVLNILGATLPKQLVGPGEGNVAGHFEPERIVELDNLILSENGSYSTDFRRLKLDAIPSERIEYYIYRAKVIIMDDFDDSELFVLKDPRVCRLVPIYIRILTQMNISVSPIIPYRNPLEVAGSLAARDKLLDVTSLLLWLRHVLDAEKSTRGMQRSFINYDRLVSLGGEELRGMEQQLGITWPHSLEDRAAEIDTIVRRDLRHHKREPNDLQEGELAARWISRCFAALEILATNPHSETAMQALDDTSAEIDNATSSLAAFQAQCDKYKQEIHIVNAQIDTYKADIDTYKAELVAEVSRHRAEIDLYDLEIKKYQDDFDLCQAELQLYKRRSLRQLEPLESVVYRGAIRLKRRKLWPYVRDRVRRVFGVKASDRNNIAAYFVLDAYVRANPGVVGTGKTPAVHFISSGIDDRDAPPAE